MSFKLENNMYIARSNYDLKLLVNKEGIHLKDIDISFVTDLSNVFAGFDFSKVDANELNTWNVSKVVTMHGLFARAKNFNADLSNWDVSSVKDMSNLFSGCKEFNSDLSKWKVNQVENFSNMFCGCEKFNADLSAWKVNQGKNFDFMFYGCKQFNQDLNNWKISLVKAHAEKMFGLADHFCHDLKKWNLSEAQKNKLGLHNLI